MRLVNGWRQWQACPQRMAVSPLLFTCPCLDLAFFRFRLHYPSLLPFPRLISRPHTRIYFLLLKKVGFVSAQLPAVACVGYLQEGGASSCGHMFPQLESCRLPFWLFLREETAEISANPLLVPNTDPEASRSHWKWWHSPLQRHGHSYTVRHPSVKMEKIKHDSISWLFCPH